MSHERDPESTDDTEYEPPAVTEVGSVEDLTLGSWKPSQGKDNTVYWNGPWGNQGSR